MTIPGNFLRDNLFMTPVIENKEFDIWWKSNEEKCKHDLLTMSSYHMAKFVWEEARKRMEGK